MKDFMASLTLKRHKRLIFGVDLCKDGSFHSMTHGYQDIFHVATPMLFEGESNDIEVILHLFLNMHTLIKSYNSNPHLLICEVFEKCIN